MPVLAKHVAQCTDKDPVLSKVKYFIVNGWCHSVENDPRFKTFFRVKDELTIEEGCILRGIRVVIPVELQQEVLAELHTNHPGAVRMKSFARLFAYWPNLDY